MSVSAWRARQSMRCFNSPLEMPVQDPAQPSMALRLFVSILHWRCPLPRLRLLSSALMPVSILHWRCQLPRTTPPIGGRRSVSILHWRCDPLRSGRRRHADKGHQVSILHWRCKALELRQTAPHIRVVSILHWRCDRGIAPPEKKQCIVLFQFSIGDAVKISSFSRPPQVRVRVSILHWRCRLLDGGGHGEAVGDVSILHWRCSSHGEAEEYARKRVSILHWRCRVSWTMNV